MFKMKNKRGVLSLGDVQGAVITLVIIGIVLTISLLVMAELSTQSTAGSFARNATTEAEQGIGTVADFQSIFGIVIAAAVVLGLVALFR